MFVMTALSVESVMFRIDILQVNPAPTAKFPLTVRVTSTFQRVGTAGATKVLDDAMLVSIPIPMQAKARPQADVSQFST